MNNFFIHNYINNLYTFLFIACLFPEECAAVYKPVDKQFYKLLATELYTRYQPAQQINLILNVKHIAKEAGNVF